LNADATVTVTHRYDLLGRRIASITTNTLDTAVDVVATGYDARGRAIRTVSLGPGASATTVQAFRSAAESATTARSLFGPTYSAPATAEHGPSLILEATTHDFDGAMLKRERGSLFAVQQTQDFYHDDNSNVVAVDSGRVMGGLPALAVSSFDGHDRIVSRKTYDPSGCKGPATVVREKRYESYNGRHQPGLVRVLGVDSNVEVDDTTGALTEPCRDDQELARVEMAYDARGRLVQHRATNHAIDPDGTLWTAHTTAIAETVFSYDARGALVVELDDDGHEITRDYDAGGVMCRSRQGHASHASLVELAVTRDGAGWVTATEETHRADNGSLPITLQKLIVLDALGRVTRTTDGVGLVRTYLYDSFGRSRVMTDENGRLHWKRYDGLGRLVSERRAAGGEGDGRELTLSNGWTVTNAQVHERFTTGTLTTLARTDVRYDARGHQTSI
jgi:YD repeat-containing protein